MCGVVGFIQNQKYNKDHLKNAIINMNNTLIHRGPDHKDIWIDGDNYVTFGHCRLSILDLSPAGHQPMQSLSGRYVIIFNGEIYNHLELRKNLQAKSKNIKWKGTSDTETLLNCFEEWGVEETLKKTTGMFAFGLWDHKKKSLVLARDRLGEKPIYYGWVAGLFMFASELKALKAYEGFANSICKNSLSLYMQHNYIPSPFSIYKNIYKLEPGCMLTIMSKESNKILDKIPEAPVSISGFTIKRWWDLNDSIAKGKNSFVNDELEAENTLEELLSKSIKNQLLSDIPPDKSAPRGTSDNN